jgi:hypothetical protein
MMDALGIARHLGANDTGRVTIVPRACHPTDGIGIE